MSSKDIVFAAASAAGPTPPPSGDPYWNDVSLLTNSADNLIFADASTNNLELIKTGVVSPSLITPFTDVGGSLWFDGGNDFVQINGSSLNLASSSTPFTIEFWINPSRAGGWVFTQPDSYNFEVSLCNGTDFTDTSGLSVGFGYYSGGWNSVTTGSNTISTGTWTHVACVFDGSNSYIYINGVDYTSGTLTAWSSDASSNYYYLGRKWDSYGLNDSIQGYLSNFMFVNGTAVYTSNFTPPTAPLTPVSGTALLINATNQNTFDNATLYDQSAFKAPLTFNNNAFYSGLSPFGNDFPGSMYFNGDNDYVDVSYLAGMTPATSTTPFTVEFWINPERDGGWVISQPSTYALEIALTATGLDDASGRYIGFGYYSGGWNYVDTIGIQEISLNVWTHVACVFDGSNSFIYINGVDCTNGTLTDWTTYDGSSSDFYIGRRWDSYGVNQSIQGNISNFRYANGTAVYTTNFTPPTAPLTDISGTGLLIGCDTGAFYDLSSNGYFLSQNGTPTVTNQQSPFATVSEAYFFNGTTDYFTAPIATMPSGTEDFTIELWANFATGLLAGNEFAFIGGEPYGGFGKGNYNSTFILYQGYFSGINFGSKNQVTENTWTHLAVTRSGDDYRLFINGVLDSSGVQTVPGISWNFGSINYIGSGFNGYFSGYMSNIRVTRGVARYVANFTPPTTPFPKSL